jgi:hypothetical protein
MCQERTIFFFQGLEVREEFFDTKDAENVTLRDGSIRVTVSPQQGTSPAWRGKCTGTLTPLWRIRTTAVRCVR